MKGIISWGVYLPYRRLDRSTIAAVAGQGGGKGTRTVASFDEDPTTLAVEAGRLALRPVPVFHTKDSFVFYSRFAGMCQGPAPRCGVKQIRVHSARRRPDVPKTAG